MSPYLILGTLRLEDSMSKLDGSFLVDDGVSHRL